VMLLLEAGADPNRPWTRPDRGDRGDARGSPAWWDDGVMRVLTKGFPCAGDWNERRRSEHAAQVMGCFRALLEAGMEVPEGLLEHCWSENPAMDELKSMVAEATLAKGVREAPVMAGYSAPSL
jgi:hypothetical protein